MIKQWKGKRRATPCAWTFPEYFIISLLSAYLFCSFPYPSPSRSSSFLFFLTSKRKREGRDKGRGWTKKSAIFSAPCFVSPSSLLISLLFVSLLFPLNMQSLLVSPLSFSLPPRGVLLGRFLHLQARQTDTQKKTLRVSLLFV